MEADPTYEDQGLVVGPDDDEVADGYARRRARARLEVSRHAATLFWERGVAGTSGDDIAAAAGLSTRTVWRHFRTKESCVEPLLAASAQRFMRSMRRWPLASSLEDFLAADRDRHPLMGDEITDRISGMRIVTLAATEPAIRTAWLMVCADAEREFIPIAARRLGISTDDVDARLCAAAVAGAVRVINEEISTAIIARSEQFESAEIPRQLARAVRVASDHRLGDPVPS